MTHKPFVSVMADVIDTSWHHSWHWQRDCSGNLTLRGIYEALRDCRYELMHVEARRKRLESAERSLIDELHARGHAAPTEEDGY